LLPPQQSQSLATLLMGQTAGSPLASMAQKEFGPKNPADIYIGLLNSRSIQDGLIHDFELGRVYRMQRPTDIRHELASHTRIQLTKEGLSRFQWMIAPQRAPPLWPTGTRRSCGARPSALQ
jgi:tyrosine-protein kinase Etk/Wzc